MDKKIYVGNLPFSINDNSLNEMFAECGTVESAKVISDRSTGQSKGFGFVEMSSSEEATEAIEKFNGKELEGRALKVSQAKPQNSGGSGGGRGGFRRNRY